MWTAAAADGSSVLSSKPSYENVFLNSWIIITETNVFPSLSSVPHWSPARISGQRDFIQIAWEDLQWKGASTYEHWDINLASSPALSIHFGWIFDGNMFWGNVLQWNNCLIELNHCPVRACSKKAFALGSMTLLRKYCWSRYDHNAIVIF